MLDITRTSAGLPEREPRKDKIVLNKESHDLELLEFQKVTMKFTLCRLGELNKEEVNEVIELLEKDLKNIKHTLKEITSKSNKISTQQIQLEENEILIKVELNHLRKLESDFLIRESENN